MIYSSSVGFETFRLGGIFQSFIRIDLVLHSEISQPHGLLAVIEELSLRNPNLGALFSLRLLNIHSIIF